MCTGFAFLFLSNNTSKNAALDLSRDTGALAVHCDLSAVDPIRQGTAEVLRQMGWLSALVNNAGISFTGLLQETEDEDWRKVMDLNLDAAFYTMRSVLPVMIGRGRGSVVNLTSMWGISGASCEAAYSAAKAGLIGLSKATAREVGGTPDSTRRICPGSGAALLPGHRPPGPPRQARSAAQADPT